MNKAITLLEIAQDMIEGNPAAVVLIEQAIAALSGDRLDRANKLISVGVCSELYGFRGGMLARPSVELLLSAHRVELGAEELRSIMAERGLQPHPARPGLFVSPDSDVWRLKAAASVLAAYELANA